MVEQEDRRRLTPAHFVARAAVPLLPCNKQKSQCHTTIHIYCSLMVLWVGWGNSVWYETLNLKQVFYKCFNTLVPTMCGCVTGANGSLSDHIQLLKWVVLNTGAALLQNVGRVQLCFMCLILIPRLQGDWKLSGQWQFLPIAAVGCSLQFSPHLQTQHLEPPSETPASADAASSAEVWVSAPQGPWSKYLNCNDCNNPNCFPWFH